MTATLFAGDVPAVYDECLGPFLFDHYAVDLARRVAVRPGGRVLETACGTGILTSALWRVLGGLGEIVATDVSEAMLEVARERRSTLPDVDWRTADAAALPFDDASFDAVVQQFGLMFSEDKVAVLREARRVLRPGGKLAFSVWGDPRTNPFVDVARRVVDSFFDVDPPRFFDVPWSCSDLDRLRGWLWEAGFRDASFELVSHRATNTTAHRAARGMVCGTPIREAVESRAAADVEQVVDAVAAALSLEFGDDPFRAPMQAVVVSARR